MSSQRPPSDAVPVPLKRPSAVPSRGRAAPSTAAGASQRPVTPIEPVVADDAEVLDDAREALDQDGDALDDALVLEPGADDGEVVDVDSGDVGAGGALVRAKRVALPGQPGGDWVQEEPVTEPTDDELNRSVKDVGSGRDGIYSAFVRQATRVSRLSEDEERALGRKVRDFHDQEAAKKLVVHNLRLAIKMAYQYRRSWTSIMDLVQESSAGMAIAAQRWDPDQGTRFGTYAVYWIRAQLTKFLMTNGRAIHTGNTRAGRKLYFQLPRIRRKLLAEGKAATVDEIAAEVHETPEEVARIVARLDGREASLDAQVGDEDGGTLGEMIAGDDRGPEEQAAQNEVGRVIAELTQRFADTLENERDRAIWREHLVAAEPKSLVELGERYGVSKQRMGQLATRIKRGFRRHIIDELGPNTQLHWLFATE